MGLLNESIEVELSSSNMKHYKSLGYKFPKVKRKNGKLVTPRGTKILVKTNDLMKGSSEIVNVKCDHCGKIFPIYYYTYTYYNHDGLYYCNNCSSTVLEAREKSPKWNYDKSIEERENGRNSLEYSQFVKSVFIRDNYKCQCCGKSNIKIEAHHLNGYNWFINGRTDVNNGITLCKNCHENFHVIYGRGDNTKSQFNEWIGYSVNMKPSELYSSKKVYCFETKEIFDSSLHAANKIGVTRNAMSSFCSNAKSTKIHCRTLKGLRFLWYDDFLKMTDEEIKDFINRHTNLHNRKVICLSTMKIFDTIKDGANFYGIKSSVGITKCCKNECSYCGKLKDGTKLKWMYYEKYEKLLEENDMKNGEVEISMEIINESYKQKSTKGS